MPRVDSSIIVHEIKTYPMARPFRKKLHQVHPRKVAAIKAEVEKLLKVVFINLVPLTKWVSNIVPVAKKQGTIRVCIDFRDLNRACHKENFPAHISIKSLIIILEASSSHLWMGFMAIIKYKFYLPTSIRGHSFVHGEPFPIRIYPLVWKTLELHSIVPCPMLFTILNTLWNPI